MMMRRLTLGFVLVLSQLLAGMVAAQDVDSPTPPPAVAPTAPVAPVPPAAPDVPAAPDAPAASLEGSLPGTQPAEENSSTAILELKYTQAVELSDILNRFFPQSHVECMPSSNLIIVRAQPQVVVEMSQLISRLEEQAHPRGPRGDSGARRAEGYAAALNELARAQGQLEAAQAAGSQPQLALMDSAHQDRQRFAEAKAQHLAQRQEALRAAARELATSLKEQRQELGDDHPDVENTVKKIEDLVKQAHQVRFREQEVELDRLRKRLQEVERELAAYRERVDQLIPREVERLIQSASPEEESKDRAR